MKGGKIWSTIVDYFLILSAIIGVGFASGKEIYVFFYSFKGASIFGLIVFLLLYIYLFFIVEYIKQKLKVKSYNEFNTAIFGALSKFSDVVMIVNFAIASAGMLAGADYLFGTFLGIGYKIASVILSVITFFILLGGIEKIKLIANFLIPIMISIIVINGIGNISPSNVNLPIVDKSSAMAIYYALLFGVTNFVAALPVLFQTKLKTKGKLSVIFSIVFIVLLNILVLASNSFTTDMPMFELSKNLGNSFYYIYFIALIFGLFSTLMICSFNMQTVILKNKKSMFVSGVIVIANLCISNLGYAFIVKHLYVFSGIVSGIYVVLFLILIVIKLIKIKNNNFKNKTKILIKNAKKIKNIAKIIKF